MDEKEAKPTAANPKSETEKDNKDKPIITNPKF